MDSFDFGKIIGKKFISSLDQQINVFSITGCLVKQIQINIGDSFSLPNGVYIIKSSKAKSAKKIVL